MEVITQFIEIISSLLGTTAVKHAHINTVSTAIKECVRVVLN